jgi:hypothetical protein
VNSAADRQDEIKWSGLYFLLAQGGRHLKGPDEEEIDVLRNEEAADEAQDNGGGADDEARAQLLKMRQKRSAGRFDL